MLINMMESFGPGAWPATLQKNQRGTKGNGREHFTTIRGPESTLIPVTPVE